VLASRHRQFLFPVIHMGEQAPRPQWNDEFYTGDSPAASSSSPLILVGESRGACCFIRPTVSRGRLSLPQVPRMTWSTTASTPGHPAAPQGTKYFQNPDFDSSVHPATSVIFR